MKLITRSLKLYATITALYFALIVLAPKHSTTLIGCRRSFLVLLYCSLWWPKLIRRGGRVIIPSWIK